MGSADGFSALNRSRDHLPRNSDCSSKRWWWGGRKYSESSKIDADLHCSATTRSAMDKWRLQADSAHQTGLDTALEEVLIVDALSSSRITVTIRQLPLDIMQSTDPHSQPQPETMPDIISTVLSGSE